MALQIFRADQHPFEVTTVTVDHMVWFKGSEVAACLGYADPQQAVSTNVDEDDAKTCAELMAVSPRNQQSSEVYVNECGLHGLVLRSQKEDAKVFKRWITSEVLPSLRQSVHTIQHKFFCMAKPQGSKEERRLLEAGKVLSSEEAQFLNELESVIQLSTWLDSRVRAPTREARRKLLCAFRRACKEARLQQAEDEESLVPLIWNMGGHRIVYTMADEDLLLEVLRKLRPRFEATRTWCYTLAIQAKKKKQTMLQRYLKMKAGSTSSLETCEDDEASSSNSMEA